MLEQFKSFDSDALDVDELVELSMFGEQYRAHFDKLNLEVPEWVDDQNRSVKLAIRARTQDILAKRIKEAKIKLGNLKTPAEKRAELESELAKLEQMAGHTI